MKKFIPFLVAAFLLSAIVPANANLVVYGIISGEVTEVSDPMHALGLTLGMPVSGTFSYDYDLLSAPDASGNRTVSAFDSNARIFFQTSVGWGGGGGNSSFGGGNLYMTVGTNLLPYFGYTVGEPDTGFSSSSVGVELGEVNMTPIDWQASVTYTITSFNPVPDTGATWFLLGIGLAGVTVARHFSRQIRV